MAGEIASAFVRIRPDMTGFKGEVEGKFRSAFSNVGKIVGGALAAGSAFELGKGIIEAAAEHQAAFTVLDRAVKNANASTNVFGTSIEKLLEKEARLKGISDEGLSQAFVRLISATHNSAKAFHDLGLAEDLSRARGIDLAAAALAISKAEQGKFNSLQRYGVVVPKVTAAEDALAKKRLEAANAGAKLDASDKAIYASALAAAKATDAQATSVEALALVHQRFGGVAAEFAKTASGQFQRLRQDFHQFEVAIGTQFLGGLASAAEGIGAFVTKLTESRGLVNGTKNVVSALGTVFRDLKDAVAVVGPPLVTVAGALAHVASTIGAPAILAAVGTFKAVGIATSVAATAEAFYARAIAASVGPTRAAAAAGSQKATATGENAAATSALTRALVANTASLAANADAGVAAARGQMALFDGYAAVTEAATTAAAANARLAESEVAAGAAGTTASTGGLGAFARGVVALGVRGGGVGTIATVGLAALAGAFVYLSTRTDDASAAMHRFESSLGAVGQAIQSIPADKLAVAQANLNVQVARASLANTKAKQGSKEYTQLTLNLKQALIDAGNAQNRLNLNVETAAKGRKEHEADLLTQVSSAKQMAVDLARGQFASEIGQGLGDDPAVKAKILQAQAGYTADSLGKFIDKLKEDAAQQRASAPLYARNIDLLAQYAQAVGHFPSKKVIHFFIENADANVTLKRLLKEMDDVAKNGGVAAGTEWWRAFSSSLGGSDPSGVWDGLSAGIAAAAARAEKDVKQGVAGRKINAAAKAAMKTLREGIALDETTLTDLRQQMTLAAEQGADSILQAVTSAKSNFSAIGQTIAQDIGAVLSQPFVVAQQQLTAETDRMALTFDTQSAKFQARSAVFDAVLQAISLRQQERAAQFAGQNALLQQQDNRAGLRGDLLNLQQLRRSVILPGGKTLSANNKEALSQLQDFANKSRGASRLAIEQFIQQYQAAIRGIEKDKIGIATTPNPKQAQRQADVQVAAAKNSIQKAVLDAKHAAVQAQQSIRADIIRIGTDVAEARARVAAKEIADLTDAFNRAPSPAALKKVTTKIADIMARDHVSFTKVGKLFGTAWLHGFQGQITGLGLQGKALFGIKGPAGGGLVPSIVHPLQTIASVQLQQAALTKSYRKTQLDEAKKQTNLLKTIARENATEKFVNSLHKNPGGASTKARTLHGAT